MGRAHRRPEGSRRYRRIGTLTLVAALAVLVLGLAGCGGGQNALQPHSKAAQQISDLWWAMMGMAWVVLLGAVFFLMIGWRRRRQAGLPVFGQDPRASTGIVVLFGIVAPLLVLSALFAAANLFVVTVTAPPAVASTRMTIHVIGHQWWWEVRYPGTTAVTANEIHIPVDTRVNVLATTDDVIHSFWVPELNRKIDMIPGQRNRIMLYADKAGVYRGQCAEFCGLQHAHMAMKVFAQPPARFRAWLSNMARGARTPTTPMQRAGRQVFLSNQCASCHTIRGTPAHGTVGPDLTHLKTRTTLAANTIPNDPGHLAGWVLDPQHVKPGNDMPGLELGSKKFQALLAYLESLR